MRTLLQSRRVTEVPITKAGLTLGAINPGCTASNWRSIYLHSPRFPCISGETLRQYMIRDDPKEEASPLF